MDDEEHRKRLLSDPEGGEEIDDSYPPSYHSGERHSKAQSRWMALLVPRRRQKIILVLPLLILLFGASSYFFVGTEKGLKSSVDELGLPPIVWSRRTVESPNPIPFLSPIQVAPKLGSDEWRALYPKQQELGPKPMAQWLERYKAMKTAQPALWARIHEIPMGSLDRSSGLAQYPENITKAELLGSEGICSYRRENCARMYDFASPNPKVRVYDIDHSLPSTWAINFDDGPLPPSATLHSFLDLHSVNATHFYIGSNIVNYTKFAIQAFERGDELSVHTWSHPHMSTLTDEQVLGELGWTMQAIVDITGHPPQFFRPPYGDIDDRIRIISRAVFNMTPVMWNGDSTDWSLDQTYASGDFVDPAYPDFNLGKSLAQIRDVIKGGKSTGRIILEHELSEDSVKAFTTTFPELAVEGWKTGTVSDVVRGMYGRP